jgi:hypothetical protein
MIRLYEEFTARHKAPAKGGAKDKKQESED